MLQEYRRGWGWGWGWGGGGVVGWLPKFRRPVAGRGGEGVLPNSDTFGQTEKGGDDVQNFNIFQGCHKCKFS